ncbi:3-carboxy-cis,cis-muconate cycloisomerase [Rhizobium sp. ARZ01]|uniref:3-carboxy-cis,cis-muconate cycloisomerase n=1 Tax=Rhizobium sp. ARZ01 TaxID=2769313 RepID=UPI001783FB51|nr:3-carboxy-cis,cis-muconate cycloisomerase [Rhizobium sp. ARZ01]MBD9374152.1 3-carboxy-cis,cis-muconate cycloisomerase [Rhizobium sp. ARZ01]
MTVSPFDHPYLSGLLGDEEIAGLFSVASELEAMLAFEVALARAQAAKGVMPLTSALTIETAARRFAPDVAALRQATARDGVVVPELVRQFRQFLPPEDAPYFHVGTTSQDVIDSGLMVRLSRAAPIFIERLGAIVGGLIELDERHGERVLMGRTRMQAAIEISVSDRLSAWRRPLEGHMERLVLAIERRFPLQFGGAAGTLAAFGDKGQDVRTLLAEALSLADVPQWHSQRERLADFANLLSLITGSLGKFGQDVALMAQDGNEIVLSGGGGSSAMPHKQNPVSAEALVTLARFNATALAGVHQALVHEQERSGSAWTLEWMLLPQMVVAAGAATRLASGLVSSIADIGQRRV